MDIKIHDNCILLVEREEVSNVLQKVWPSITVTKSQKNIFFQIQTMVAKR